MQQCDCQDMGAAATPAGMCDSFNMSQSNAGMGLQFYLRM